MATRDYHDIFGGLSLVIVGTFFYFQAQDYAMGTLVRMGPGFFPAALGATLILLGILIVLPGFFRPGVHEGIKWRNLFTIAGSIILFGVGIQFVGLFLASLIACFVAASADRKFRLKTGLLLAFCVAVITCVVFVLILALPIALWPTL